MTKGKVVGIAIAQQAGASMQPVGTVMALKGIGLAGDRYARGEGSWNKAAGVGNRQVTLINVHFVEQTGFLFTETRRNIATRGIELMRLVDEDFVIGGAVLHGVKYCYPCDRPTVLAGVRQKFSEAFHDCGGLIADVVTEGVIAVDSPIFIAK